jgi:hypothetical protein
MKAAFSILLLRQAGDKMQWYKVRIEGTKVHVSAEYGVPGEFGTYCTAEGTIDLIKGGESLPTVSKTETEKGDPSVTSLANKSNDEICYGLKFGNPDFILEAKNRGLTATDC